MGRTKATHRTGHQGGGARDAEIASQPRCRGTASRWGWAALSLALLLACGGGEESAPDPGAPGASTETPADLDRALVLALAQFENQTDDQGRPKPVPGAARMEFLVREGGAWKMRALEDPASNVFHKVMHYRDPEGGEHLLSAGGSGALLKLWTPGPSGFTQTTLWEKDFGGRFSRMRDVESGDLHGDGVTHLAVATHDQGVVAVVDPAGPEVTEIDQRDDTFVHEIELGDLDGDGDLEVYSTPSEPNRLDGSVQTGQVTRYVPASGEGRVVVADLKDRHAKEIYVGDVDGNGRDELYVVVEGHVAPGGRELTHGVEVRRYEADTPPDQGVVVAEVRDRLARFLTAGDIEGDGRQELVLATFSTGLWLLRPGEDPMEPWKVSSIDRDSGGFEHASILTDLDGDGRDELYVASDKHKAVRRYTWNGRRLEREVIYERSDGRPIFTWNLMPVPRSLVP